MSMTCRLTSLCCFALLLCSAMNSRAWCDDTKKGGDAPAETVTEPATTPITALINGRLLTMTDAGEIESGTILIQDGKILEAGDGVEVPEGARVLDLAGRTVTPGLIDLRSELWLTRSAASDTGSTAALNSVDGVDPYNDDWKEVARQGVTAVYIQPAARGTFGGFGVALRVADGRAGVDSIVIKNESGFQSSLGVGTANSSSRARLTEFSGLQKRLKDAKEYKEQLTKFREYEEAEAKKKAEAKEAKEKADAKKNGKKDAEKKDDDKKEDDKADVKKEPGEKEKPSDDKKETPKDEAKEKDVDKASDKDKGEKQDEKADEKKDDKKSDKKEEPPKKPKFDPLKERIMKVLDGCVPLRLEVHGGDDVRRALEIGKEFEISLILEGLGELASSADAVGESMLPIVLGPWLESERESYQSPLRTQTWQNTFAEYPGRMVIASFGRSGRASKDLRAHAAVALSLGVDRSRVLEAITTVPATLAGIGASHGKLKKGYAADIAVFAGDPLDPTVPAEMVFSKGELTYEGPLEGEAASKVGEQSLVNELEISNPLPNRYVIKSSRVLDAEGEFVARQVVVSEGKIEAVDEYEKEIADVAVFDVGDAVVTPGLVSVHAELTLESLVDRQGLADSGPVRAADVYDSLAPLIKKLAAGGFLRVASVPGNDRVIAGQAAEVRLLAKDPIVNAFLAEKIVLSGAARSLERFPSSLAGQQQLIRESLGGRNEPSSLFLPKAAIAVLDAGRTGRQQSIEKGERPVILVAETDGELAAGIKLVKELGFRGVLTAGDQYEPILPAIAESSLGVIIRPLRPSDYDWYADDLAALSGTGVELGFAGQDAIEIRRTAAVAVERGMPRSRALRALTSGGAALVGMSESAGKLLPGGSADVVIWSGSPLNIAARPLAIIVDGTLVDEK